MKKKSAGKMKSRNEGARVKKMRAQSTTAESAALICVTKFDAARELKARIGRGSVRMLSDWLKQGMPGRAAHGGKPGHFPIDEMVVWARENLDDLSPKTDEATLLALETKRQKNRQEQLKTEEMERDSSERAGNILPRDEWTQFARDAIGVARTQLAALPKELAGMISEPKLQRAFLNEATKRISTTLDRLADEFARGQDRVVA